MYGGMMEGIGRPVQHTAKPVQAARLAQHDTGEPVRARKKPRTKKPMVFIGIIVALLLVVGGWFAVQYYTYRGIDTSRYQAVYLDNENVYFG